MRWRPRRVGLLLLVALLVGSPVAADSPFAPLPTTIQLDFAEPEPPPGVTWGPVTTTATVTYCYTAAGAAAGRPTRVTLDVTDAPAWGVVTVSPALFDVPFTHVPLGTRDCANPQPVRFSVTPLWGHSSGRGIVTVNVTAHENAPNQASWSTNSAFIGPGTMQEDARPHPVWTARAPAPMEDRSVGFAPLVVLAVGVAGVGVLVARRRG